MHTTRAPHRLGRLGSGCVNLTAVARLHSADILSMESTERSECIGDCIWCRGCAPWTAVCDEVALAAPLTQACSELPTGRDLEILVRAPGERDGEFVTVNLKECVAPPPVRSSRAHSRRCPAAGPVAQ